MQPLLHPPQLPRIRRRDRKDHQVDCAGECLGCRPLWAPGRGGSGGTGRAVAHRIRPFLPRLDPWSDARGLSVLRGPAGRRQSLELNHLLSENDLVPTEPVVTLLG